MNHSNPCNKFRKDNQINGNSGDIVQHGMIFLVAHVFFYGNTFKVTEYYGRVCVRL